MSKDEKSASSGTDQKKHSGEISELLDIPEECEHGEDCGAKHLERLSTAFLASAHRWEMVVYPSLFAFIVLAGYGFYLIYSLTSDAHEMTKSMDQMTRSMVVMTREMTSVSKNMVVMSQIMGDQAASMRDMSGSMRSMNVSMNQMRYDFSIMNQSVSRPMSFMNSFMPW